MKTINQIVTWFAKKVNSLIEIYNGIPFLDDTNLVEFQIDTTNATSKINELEAKLKNIEEKRKVFEMNTNFNTDTFVAPEVDTENLKDPTYELVVQVNGKKKYTRDTDIGLDQLEVENICKEEFNMNISEFKKIIYIKDKIINFVE